MPKKKGKKPSKKDEEAAAAEEAERLRREVFEYRTQTDKYRDDKYKKVELGNRIGEITAELMQSDATGASMHILSEGGFGRRHWFDRRERIKVQYL